MNKNQKIKYLIYAVVLLIFLYPEIIKRPLYPLLFGQRTTETLSISAQDKIEDIETTKPLNYTAKKHTVQLHPVAKYAVTGKSVFIDRYGTLFEKIAYGHNKYRMLYSAISPADIAIFHGKAAADEVLKTCKFKHEYRTLWTQCQTNPDRNDYNNYHLIPATPKVRRALEIIMPDDIIHIEGLLVDVSSAEYANFSLQTGRRQDAIHKHQFAGGQYTGMCFILYTTKIIVNGYIYE